MKKLLVVVPVALALVGCVTTHDAVLDASQSQVQVRNYQSRAFDTTDKDSVLRAVISTMQDLGFIIDKADKTLGTVSGTNYAMYKSKLTVSVREAKNRKQTLVRANAQVGINALESPKAYQNFYNALSKSLFLQAHEIE